MINVISIFAQDTSHQHLKTSPTVGGNDTIIKKKIQAIFSTSLDKSLN